jgi:metallophosphoesterase superfamily enzyme
VVTHSILPDAVLDSRLALFLPATRTLVVADLHWGYAESHRATGNLLPAWGDDQIEATLRALIADHAPAELVWLGDSLHTARSAPQARACAEAFVAASPIPVHVVAGNHDARWSLARPDPLVRDRFLLHHGDRVVENPYNHVEIVGHHHPAYVHRDGAGARLKLPALVQSPTRLVLPAFSPWAAGVAWNDRLAPDDILWGISPRRLLPIRAPR